jgi:large subunit ribosomal protein L22
VEVVAKNKGVRSSPQKMRLVADMIRGQKVDVALDTLHFCTKKAAHDMRKTLESAIANAEHNHGLDIDELRVLRVFVDKGPVMKRHRPRAKGRAGKILKPSCHITVVVAERADEGK